MKPKRILLIRLFFIVLIVSVSIHLKAQTDSEQRALWIWNISFGTTWQNEHEIDTFTIGVFSSKDEYDYMKKFSADKTIKGKPVEVFLYDDYEKIPEHHIVYVTKNENAYLGFVYDRFKDQNVMIVSDRSHQPEYSVVNFTKTDEAKKFDLNHEFGQRQHLEFTEQVKKLGGDRQVLKDIYDEKNKELSALKIAHEKLKAESAGKDAKIKAMETEIEELKEEIERLKGNN